MSRSRGRSWSVSGLSLVLTLLVLGVWKGSAEARRPLTPAFLYVANMRSSTISGWAIDPVSGSLQPLANTPLPCGRKPTDLCVDPSGRTLYVACQGDQRIDGFAIDDAGGLQKLGSAPWSVPGKPLALAIDASGTWLFTTLGTPANRIMAWRRGRGGALAPGPQTPLEGNPQPIAIALDASSGLLYTANYLGGSMSAMVANPDGTLIGLPFSPFAVGVYPQAVVTHPSGRFVYVPGASSGNLSGFSVDVATRTVAPLPGSPFSAGLQPADAVCDPTGRRLYVADYQSGDIEGVALDAESGCPTVLSSSPFSSGQPSLRALTIDPSGRFLYAADITGSRIVGFRIRPENGALVSVEGAAVPADDGPIELVVVDR